MKKNEKWIVALDFSPMDTDILQYAKSLSELIEPKEIVFVNVLKEENKSPYISDELMDYTKVVAEEKRLILRNKIDHFFFKTQIPYDVQMLEGEPFAEISELTRGRKSDLVIIGKKHQSNGSGVLSDRLSKALEANFLLVPQGFKPKFENVLVSSDFSEYSALGLKQALDMRSAIKDMNIHVFNSFSVPIGYSKMGKSYLDFKHIMEENTQRLMNLWLKEYSATGNPILRSQEDKSITRQLIDVAIEKQIDLIIIGSKGQTNTTRMFLGSNTWRLVQENNKIPLLIVKKKGQSLKLKEFIDEI